ncbi:nuclear receptor 2C2-associated protein [Lucilia sericata]|uniref:nuclear receptor 2C2-associated protein n=1 Tax=Lucilia sericata TaxID=13632 RepID=UPI0018A80C48|nr:nuclear receptor 2C2-associated protein [Lucilia sericata]
MDLLNNEKFKCSVSSVLNKDTKQHGKQFLYDQQDDTAWSSNEGIPQWIAIEFEEPQTVKSFSFQFQGGFAAKEAKIQIHKPDSSVHEEPFYAEDINAVQNFTLAAEQTNVKRVKFIIESSTDFFGRIIVYNLKIF